MSNVDNELLDLSKEFYSLSKLKTGKHFWSKKNPRICNGDDFMEGMSFPYYTSDFLFGILPRSAVTRIDRHDFKDPDYVAESALIRTKKLDLIKYTSDNPRKSLLRLGIAMKEKGIKL